MWHPQQIAVGEARARFPSLTSPPRVPPDPCHLQREARRAVPLPPKPPPPSLVSFRLFVSYRIDIAPENTLWVGAWWIGFLGAGAASLLISIPILGYPQRLPGTWPGRGSGEPGSGPPGTHAPLGAGILPHACSWRRGGRGRASSV